MTSHLEFRHPLVKLLSRIFLLCTVSSYPGIAFATTYYIDSNQTGYNGGSPPGGVCTIADSARGTSPADPWCTIRRMQSAIASAQPGDSFLLKRGDTWNEMLVMPHPVNGTAGHPITIGNYGVGGLPCLDGQHIVP